jgi:hypothetical protein
MAELLRRALIATTLGGLTAAGMLVHGARDPQLIMAAAGFIRLASVGRGCVGVKPRSSYRRRKHEQHRHHQQGRDYTDEQEGIRRLIVRRIVPHRIFQWWNVDAA